MIVGWRLTNHQVPPRVSERRTDAGDAGDTAGDEDSAATAEVTVKRVGEPVGEEGAGEVGHGVDDALQPFVPGVAVRLRGNTEVRRPEQVRTVDGA